jgi:uncharacterized protein (TIGR03067 family)
MTSSTPQSQADLSLATLKRLDNVCAAYESAWKAGQQPRLEDYVSAVDEPERTTRLRELLKLEVELRTAAGQTVSAAEYYPRFPEYTELIGALLAPGGATIAGSQDQVATPSTTGTAAETPESAHADLLTFLQPPTKPGTLGRLGHYEVQEVVGRGGMGVVLKSVDEKLQRIVAVKVLGPQYAMNASARRRFEREAKAAAAVSHDHIVPIYHVDEINGVPFLVMPLIVGKSLQERLDQSGPLGLKEILRIGSQIACGLAAAHKQGVVHRDIKPANILLENGVERVKITDFGLARAVDDASVTQSGVITGTPMYMAPEQARGEQVDYRADLFSLGSVMYAMCTGHSPFRASGTHAVLMRVIEDTPRPIQEANPELPDWLNDIVMKLLAKKPEDRFQEAKEVAELLEQHLAHIQQPHVAPRPAPVKVAAAAEDQTVEVTRPLSRSAWPIVFVGSVFLMIVLIVGMFTGSWSLVQTFYAAPILLLAGIILYGLSQLRRTGPRQQSSLRQRIPSDAAAALDETLPEPNREPSAQRAAWPIALVGAMLLIAIIVFIIAAAGPRGNPGASSAILVVVIVTASLGTYGFALYRWHKPRESKARPLGPPSRSSEEPSRRSYWSRLGWFAAAYVLVLFVLAIFINFNLEGGWWATPWIEFIAAPVFLAFAFWQWGRGIRPIWLPVIPILLAIFIGSLGLVLWPFSTERHFCRLVRYGRYEEANQLLLAPDRFSFEEGGLVFRGRGAMVHFIDQDLPLYGRGGSWDNFDEHLRSGTSDEFPFYLGASADDHCRLHFTASEGVIHFQMVRFKDLQSQRRMMPEMADQLNPKPEPAVAKLPEAADEVLAAMVGTWRAEISHKIVNGQPTKFSTEGFADIGWVAGKHFLRIREQVGPPGANFVQVFSYDPKTSDFGNFHFDAAGMVMGPTTSRWDSRTHMLTGTSQPDATGLMVKNTRFIDANTMEWEAICRDTTGKTIFDTSAKLTRSAGPAKINEDEAPAPVPKEMAVLHNFVGEWQTGEWQSDGVVNLPVRAPVKSRQAAAKVLGGRFVAVQESEMPAGNETYKLMTYDVSKKLFRVWIFISSGEISEYEGVWNPATPRLSWSRIAPDGIAHSITIDWRGPDQYRQSIAVRNAAGALAADWRSTTTRQSKLDAAAMDGWTWLFNRRDLTGWVSVTDPKENNTSPWDVADGVLIAKGRPQGYLRTDRPFKDYLMKLEYRHAPPVINQATVCGGVMWEVDGKDKLWGSNFRLELMQDGRVNIRSSEKTQPITLNILGQPATDGWNDIIMACTQRGLEILINGKQVFFRADYRPRSGYVALMSLGAGMHFRNIAIKDLPTAADANAPHNVLARFHGTWNFVSNIQHPPPKKPEDARAAGVTTFEPVAGGKFLRGFANYDDGHIENLLIQTYDQTAHEFKGWYFNSDGHSSGPGTGAWDPATQTLTWRETIEGLAVNAVHDFKFLDADTIQTHLVHKRPNGELTYELRNTFTRAKQIVTPKTLPIDPKRPELATVLDGLAGFWRNELTVKTAEEADKPTRSITDHHVGPVLAGHFFEAHEDNAGLPGQRDYWVVGLKERSFQDAAAGKQFRFWHFSANGGHAVFNGAWDDAKKKISWKASEGSSDGSWVLRFPDARHIEFTVNDPAGKFVRHATGVSKKLQSPLIKAFTAADPLLTTDGVTPDQGGWRIDSKDENEIRLLELQYPGVDDCAVILKAKLKTRQLEGGASLRMWARLVDQEFWSKGEVTHQVAGTTNWSEYEIPFYFQKGQFPNRLQVGLRLGGKGTVWIKDVELERRPLGPFGIPQKKAEAPPPSDREKLRGVWKAVQVGAKGGKALEAVPEGLVWTFRFEDSKAVVHVKASAPFAPKLILVDKSYDGNVVVDDAVQPKRLSLVKPGNNIKSLAGIYRWEGQRLVLSCYFDPKENQAYPKSFTPGDDKDAVIFVLERQP